MENLSRRSFISLTAAGGAIALMGAGLTAAQAANNNKIAWDFLRNKGFTAAQTAGFIGNWIVESGADPINPAAVQGGGGPGRGIAQWEGPRRTALFNYANSRGIVWQNLGLQLDFVWKELTSTESSARGKIQATTTVRDAAIAVRKYYERPGTIHEQRRIDAAQRIYAQYSGGTPPANSSFPVLSLGSTGTAVRSMQYFLRQRGYPNLAADSSFGPATDKAVRGFQQSNGLANDGKCGPNTWKALLIEVRMGSTGQAVRGMQLELRDEGYNLAVDGSFGTVSDKAVRDYQAKKQLPVDGSCGPVTWGALID